MKSIYLPLSLALVLLSACGQDELSQAKEELAEKKVALSELKTEIAALEERITQLDTSKQETRQRQLVTTLAVSSGKFEHFLEVRGDVQSDRNVVIGAESAGAVEQVYVEEGQQVRKGQVLLRIDDALLQNNISEVKTQLELAKAVYERQKNLYDQNIGTEVQYLQAKASYEAQQNRLRTLQTQQSKTQLRAPFSGTVERLNVRLGEMAQPGMPLVQLVSLEDMYLQAEVSEAYIGKFKAGNAVEVYFPSLDKTYTTQLSSVGQVINSNNRTFTIEAKLPATAELLRPNLLAVLKIKDFEQVNAITIPTNLIQRDNKGEYVYLVKDQGEQKQVAKQHIETGISYNNQTLITEGLQAGDVLVDEGFRQVNDGVLVRIAEKSLTAASN